MIKKTISYLDYNDEERSEDFYFNLEQAEIIEMELSIQGGLAAKINRVIAAKDIPEIMKVFKWLIEKSYGEKSADGREFVKGPEITRRFMQTRAYNNFFMDLCSKDGEASAFVNALIPSIEATPVSVVK